MSKVIEYTIGKYQIRINFWFLIIFLLMQTLLNELGFWQLERAKEKRHRIAQLAKGSETILTDLDRISAQQINQFQSVQLDLVLESQVVLLLDNKIDKKRPGYHVLNVAREASSGKRMLVNRGWVFAGGNRDKLPEIKLPDTNWTVNARIYPMVSKAISTAGARIEESFGVLRLPYLDLEIKDQLERQLGIKLENYLLRLNSDSAGAYKANWVWTNMKPEKHLAYALQWFALAFAFLIVSVVVSIKKR